MVSVGYTDDGGQTQYLEQLKPPPEDAEDCCQVAKDVFNESVRNISKKYHNRITETMPDIININNLNCDDFLKMLRSLFNIKGSGDNDMITATTQAVGRYIRLDKIPTSYFGAFANIVKQSGALALEAWNKCQENSVANTNDPRWQNMLERSSDNKFNTWDNILLEAYKPLTKKQKGE